MVSEAAARVHDLLEYGVEETARGLQAVAVERLERGAGAEGSR